VSDDVALRCPTVRVGTLAWAGAAAVFAAMRLLALLNVPVGGIELWTLSGAWQARTGFDDARFVPTLFQALTAAMLRLDDGETPARLLAFAASLTIPLSLYLLRRQLGEAVALIAVVLLALDPLQLVLGATANAAALDLPLILAALALRERLAKRPALAAAAAFLAATAGAVILPFALAALFAAPRRAPLARASAGAAALGAAAGVAFASVGFGAGWQGLTVPPFDLFAAGFDSGWSTESTARLIALYAWVPAAIAAVTLAYGIAREGSGAFANPLDRVAATWLAVAGAWCLVAGGSRDPLPVASLTPASALPAAQGLARLIDSVAGADWRRAGWPLAAALIASVTLIGPLLDWARLGRVGPDSEVVAVIALAGVIAGALALLARSPATRPVALLPLAAVAATPWLSGGFAVASGSPNEPLPSPVTTLQASELRDLITGPSRDPSGIVVIHPSLADALTWPLRGARGLVVASRIPPNAAVVIWEGSATPPDGFGVVEGRWAILRERNGPRGGFLDYLGWLADRNTLPVSDVPAAIFVREAE
jgi:hypothetical protein